MIASKFLVDLDFDSAFLGFLCLRKSDGEDAVLAFSLDVLLVNVFRKCEGSGEGWSGDFSHEVLPILLLLNLILLLVDLLHVLVVALNCEDMLLHIDCDVAFAVSCDLRLNNI